MKLHIYEYNVTVNVNDSLNDNEGMFIFSGRPFTRVPDLDDAILSLRNVVAGGGALDKNWIALEMSSDTLASIKMMGVGYPDAKFFFEGAEKHEYLLECQDCHCLKPEVRMTFCPYAEDVNGEEVPITVCNDCYHARAEDV